MEHPRKLPPVVDERFWGKCCFCGCPITPKKFKRQEVIAVMNLAGSALACLRHFTTDGKDRAPTFIEATEALLKAAIKIGVTNIPDQVTHYFSRK